jgi:Flp pilus assembly protein TadD, contains TPR repeats
VGSAPPQGKTLTNEQVLESSGNDLEIIDLYKNQLKEKESEEVRIKLVKRYLEIKDYDSARFYLAPLLQQFDAKDPTASNVLLLAGKVSLGLEQWAEARKHLTKVQQLAPSNSESANLLGILSAREGNFTVAREWFNHARSNMADDRTIKNNLALLDVFEERYTEALRRLQPVPDLRQLSDRTRVTLSLIYAKTDQYSAFEVLTDNMAKSDRVSLYQQLQALPVADFPAILGDNANYGSVKIPNDVEPKPPQLSERRPSASSLSVRTGGEQANSKVVADVINGVPMGSSEHEVEANQ